jgi:hypothetical protein
MKLSKYFTLEEFIKSQTAVRKGIDNMPPEPDRQATIDNMRALARNVLDPMRENYARPIMLSSGYRSPALNRAVGGSKTSQHCFGEAADTEVQGIGNPTLARWIIKNLDFDQVILEFYNPLEGPNSGWVHVSYTRHRPNRRKVTTAMVGRDGKTVYMDGLVLQ